MCPRTFNMGMAKSNQVFLDEIRKINFRKLQDRGQFMRFIDQFMTNAS